MLPAFAALQVSRVSLRSRTSISFTKCILRRASQRNDFDDIATTADAGGVLGTGAALRLARLPRRLFSSSAVSVVSSSPWKLSATGGSMDRRPGTGMGSSNAASNAGKTTRATVRISPVLYGTSACKRRVSAIGFFFLGITYIWSIILFIPMLIAHPFVLLFDNARRRFHDIIAMAWMQMSMRTVLLHFAVYNRHNLLPDGKPVVYVANHASYIDIYAFSYLNRRIKYLSKSEIFRMPVVGWAMAMTGNIALRRMNRRGQMEAYRSMINVLRNGLSLVVFPEGTRSQNGKMRRFQAGAFRAAKAANVPVVPITIHGTREMMPANALVPLRYPPKQLALTVHQPIHADNYSVDELRDAAFKSIDSALPTELQSCTHEQQQFVQGAAGTTSS